MEYREIWGISIERISEYFASQPDVRREDGEHFICATAAVKLTRLPDNMIGPSAMPCTEVYIIGDSVQTEALHRRFFLRFLSAGG